MVQGDDVVFDPWSIVDGNMLIVDAEDGTELEFEYSEESPQELENRIEKLREATEGAKYSNKNKADGILRQTALNKRDPHPFRYFIHCSIFLRWMQKNRAKRSSIGYKHKKTC